MSLTHRLAELARQSAKKNGQYMHGRSRPREDPGLAGVKAETPEWPEPLDQAAYHGLAGEFVRAIEPHTEADPIGVLLQFLTIYGNVIGRSAHFVADGHKHFLNLFVVLVGRSAIGRKGTALNQAKRPFRLVAYEPVEKWLQNRNATGLSSGEGLISECRDGETDDKRLLVVQAEFASVLKNVSRETNTLSPIIREAWDNGNLRTMTKNSPLKATGAHISLIGHITAAELQRYLSETEAANGFANRFLWPCVKRSKSLPDGGRLTDEELRPIAKQLAASIGFAQDVAEMHRDAEARDLWYAVYPQLTEGPPGMLGAVTTRGAPQTMRLACIYALLDGSDVIALPHLTAALALWDYCLASARYIFGDSLGDPTADEILSALKGCRPEPMSRTEISNLFSRNKSKREISRALGLLKEHGRILEEATTSDSGVSIPCWRYADESTKYEKYENGARNS